MYFIRTLIIEVFHQISKILKTIYFAYVCREKESIIMYIPFWGIIFQYFGVLFP